MADANAINYAQIIYNKATSLPYSVALNLSDKKILIRITKASDSTPLPEMIELTTENSGVEITDAVNGKFLVKLTQQQAASFGNVLNTSLTIYMTIFNANGSLCGKGQNPARLVL